MTGSSRVIRFVMRHPVGVILTWVIAAGVMFGIASFGVGGAGSLDDRTETGAPEVKGSDSYLVRHILLDHAPQNVGTPMAGQFTGADPYDPGVQAALAPLLPELAALDGVALVNTPFAAVPGPAVGELAPVSAGDPSSLVATSGDTFLLAVTIAPSVGGDQLTALEHDIKDRIEARLSSVQAAAPGATLHVFGTALFFESFEKQLARDLVVGEAIALPLALIVMVLVFGGFLAASTPIAGAIASIAGGLAVLYVFTFPLQVDSSAKNVVTVLGIGLCVDYGLLIVSRYREELTKALAAGGPSPRDQALTRTMQTAGRTVFFSAVTVGISVGGMLVFKPEFLRAFGGAALGVVATAMLVAMTLVPAIAYLYGEKLVARGILTRVPGLRRALRVTSDVEMDEGAFSRLAAWVQRRPWLVVLGCLGVLGVLAAPALGLTVRNSESEMLPPSDPDRQYLGSFDANYPLLAEATIDIVAEASPAEFDAWSGAITDVDGVVRVAPASLRDGRAFSGVYINVSDPGSPEAVAIVDSIRELDAPFDLYVGGQAANQRDFIDSIREGAPAALGIVVAATFILLFLMTGSLLVPLKTLIINTLSLSASLGVLVWIFQEGHLEGLLRFDSLGGIETYVVVLVISFGFGLAMDYEVFLLARIKELVDRGVPNNEAVRLGLQRSGRIITSAAAIIILVFLGFAAGSVLVIKEVGIGLAFAVFLDATLVRMLLVPATMTLLGDWNWWAPKGLRGIYRRLAITH